MIELTINIKNSETSLIERETLYDSLVLSPEDPKLKAILDKARNKFLSLLTAESDKDIDTIVKAKMLC